MIKRYVNMNRTFKVIICFLTILLLFGFIMPVYSAAETADEYPVEPDSLNDESEGNGILNVDVEIEKPLHEKNIDEENPMDSIVAPMAIVNPGPGSYNVAATNLILDVTGSSTNNHTQALMAWYDEYDNFYVAIQSTHELQPSSTMKIYSAPTPDLKESTETHFYHAGLNDDGKMTYPIIVGGVVYDEKDGAVNGNIKDTRWTVYKFENTSITAGDYTFDVTGIGKGHDIEGRPLKISVPKVDIYVEKVWNGGDDPRPDVRLQLYIGEEAVSNTSVTLKHPDTTHTWRDVEKTDGKGKLYEYTVIETPVLNYKTAVTGNMNDGFIVENTFTPTITIKKIVTGNLGDLSRQFEFTVISNKGKSDEETFTFELSNGLEETLKGLPAGAILTLTEESGGYKITVIVGETEIIQPNKDGECMLRFMG